MTVAKNFGDFIQFTDPDGNKLVGVVVARDWAFDKIFGYTVKCASGLRYFICADNLTSSYSF